MDTNNKENKIIINLDMTENNILESNIEIDGTSFNIKFKEGNIINITMTEGFAARHNIRVQKGMFFLEGDLRYFSSSPIMKGSINILGLEFKDSYFERFHEAPGKIYMGLDYFENANLDIINRKITLITTQEHFNVKLAERNSQYSEDKDNNYEPDIFSFTVGDKKYYDIPTDENEYIIERFKEKKKEWEEDRRNPIINLQIHEYAYEPMEYIMKISEEVFKCYMGEYGDGSDKFLEAWDSDFRYLKMHVSKEEMIKQYEKWKESQIEHIWKPRIDIEK